MKRLLLLLLVSFLFVNCSTNTSSKDKIISFSSNLENNLSNKMIGTWKHNKNTLMIFKEGGLLLVKANISKYGWRGNKFELVYKDAGYYLDGVQRISYVSSQDIILYNGKEWKRIE